MGAIVDQRPQKQTAFGITPGTVRRRNRKSKRFGCGYFLATRKAAKNQVILGVAAAEMAGNSRVIEENAEYPLV